MTDTNNKTDIDALNDVTKVLIDSQKGYEKCAELADESFGLRSQFQQRANDRATLVSRFQAQVRTYGGEPQTEGGALGALHRGFTQFASVFKDDRKAALEAIDDGEEHLAKAIEDRLETPQLQSPSRTLLDEAYTSARSGEAFADSLT